MNIKKENLYLVLILTFGFVVRLYAANQSLWLDEAIGAIAVKNFTYGGIFKHFIKVDNHPPLYYLLLKFWSGIFGYSEISLRMPSILTGLGTIFVTYKIAQLIKIEKNSYLPLFSAILTTMSPFHIYYSQEARMYSMAALLASLSVYFYVSQLKRKENKSGIYNTVGFTLSLAALVFTDYVPVFLIPVFWIYSIFTKKLRSVRKLLIVSHLLIVAVSVFWLPYFRVQAENGKWLMSVLPAWREIAGGATLKQLILVWMKFTLGRISFSDKILYYTLVTISSIPFVMALTGITKAKKYINLLILWIAAPLMLGFISSYWFPAFVYFRFVYIVPAFYLLIAWSCLNINRKIVKNAVCASIITVCLVGSGIYLFDPNQHREDWKGAVSFLESNVKSNEVVVFGYPEPFAPYRWYSSDSIDAVGVTDSISLNEARTAQKTERSIRGKSAIYYFEYLRDLADPGQVVKKTMETEGFVVSDVYDFNNVGHVYYLTKGI